MRIHFARLMASLLLARASVCGQELPPGFESVDAAFRAFMRTQNTPGAAVAIVKDGRLVLARGYGFADVERGQAVKPDSLFRIGSLSKTITAIAVMQLVQSGKLDLEAKAFEILSNIRSNSGRIADARISRITVRNLLQHAGGWDSARSGDPMLLPGIADIASAMHVPYPPSPETIISFMLGRNLDFDPGTRYAYSNFGYCVLGRIVERVSGRPYEEFVRVEILAPLGIARMRQGHSSAAARAEGEVRYYDYPGASLTDALLPGEHGEVAMPYSGAYPLESVDSVGAWIGAAADIARIFTMLDSQRPPPVLTFASILAMIGRPTYVAGSGPYYGFGIDVEPVGADSAWWHDGGLPGTHAFAIRVPGGWTWVALFNSQPKDYSRFNWDLSSIFVPDALAAVSWPDSDLFPQLQPSGRPTVAPGGIVNAADGASGPVAPGELVSIYGTFLGPPAGPVGLSPEGFFPSENSGIRVWIDHIAAPLLFVSASQVNAAVPFGAAGCTEAEVRVEAFGYQSAPLSVACADASPALFTTGSVSGRQAAALNEDGGTNSKLNPAAAGSWVAVFGTGFGATIPASIDGGLNTSSASGFQLPIRITVDGTEARVTYAGPAPMLVAGVSQINFLVPADTMPGTAVIVVSAGKFSALPATLAVK